MYLNDVKQRLAKIKILADEKDNEQAHGEEDSLWEEVLRAIGTGQYKDAPPEDFAFAALKALDWLGKWLEKT